ncbi:uncharacterized protein ACB058_012847 isoform 1-T2 [Synchiropus picturatus]
MTTTLWTVFTWTLKGLLCTCRFLWVCPYNAVKFLPRKKLPKVPRSSQRKRTTSGTESKAIAAIPGSPDRAADLQKRLTKTERDILSLRTKIACEKASWERRFEELKRKQEEICQQLGVSVGVQCESQEESGVENGLDAISGCSLSRDGSSGSSSRRHSSSQISTSSDQSSRNASLSASASTSSVRSWKTTSPGPHRVFVPHSPMDLQLGHRVRVMLPSGRISTGTVRFLGHLQGETDIHLGVELQKPDLGLHDGSHKGHNYFECKRGYGAFVPFHKLLMAWE